MAPGFWRRGEREAVLAYLEQDAVMTMRLAQSIFRKMWRNRGSFPAAAQT